MHKLLEFIRTIYVFLLFLIFEIVALNYYAHSSAYAQAKLLTRSNKVVGGVHGVLYEIRHYFSLRAENDELLARVAELENSLSQYASTAEVATESGSELEELSAEWAQYAYMTARVVSLSINKHNNFMVINRGMDDGVRNDMAVLSPRGAMVGYVVGCSNRYAVVLPMLNTSFRASGKLLRGSHFGSIVWDGYDAHKVRLTELSKYATPEKGDTIVSTGFSSYFPEGIVIGRVSESTMNEMQTAYDVDVELAVDFTALHRVILIDNRDQSEIESLIEQATGTYNK